MRTTAVRRGDGLGVWVHHAAISVSELGEEEVGRRMGRRRRRHYRASSRFEDHCEQQKECGFLRVLAGLSFCPVGFAEWTILDHKHFAAEPHRPQIAFSRGGYVGSWKNPPRLQADQHGVLDRLHIRATHFTVCCWFNMSSVQDPPSR
jgi:hypothetical protein